ncbi:MAG: hypothetical protein HZC22_10110 [Rhodocyclales bacterium]|nr:hypothetical protein [Rhodocyclales bacterium]
MKLATLAVAFLALGLASCSSIKTVESPSAKDADGLTYFMPKKDFLVTVTIKDKKVEKVALGATASYPDLSKQYLLRHGGNAFGKNTLDVGISDSGLLTSTKSTTQSNVTDAFRNLATSLGQRKSLGFERALDSGEACTTNGDHTFVFKASGSYAACGIKITIEKQIDDSGMVSHSKAGNTEHSGIFYRQNIPYLVTATGGGLNVAALVFSPSESKTHFLPVSRTFFSNNNADFGFADGVPSKYKQETEGEAVALLKLPADILSAYFGAIGSIFDSFKSNDTKEAAALAESLKLELAKKKYDACIAAIKANDDQKIKELACQ